MKLNYTALTLLFFATSTVLAAADASYTYLALGDSVAFGLNATLLPPYSQQTPTPSEFIGYPETLAAWAHLQELNASCPGETSGSFLDTSVPDNGCNSPHFQPPAPTIPPFKTNIGLHTAYTSSQISFAESQFESNPHINLVTLSIGANDILLVLPALAQCTDQSCIQGVLAPVLQAYGANLAQILTRIRAHYQGTLVLLTYYSPAPALDGVAQALNGVMTQVASQLSGKPGFPRIVIADGFTAFKLLAAPFQDDACKAGLLIKLPPSQYTTSPCDIHPSPPGRDVLAAVIEVALLAQQ
jgi:lysophospholipase L1-like esterase